MIKLDMDKVMQILRQNGKYRIIFIGDSLTSCEWIHPNWREIVEYVLKQELENKFEDWKIPSWGIRCLNFGFDGSTTKDILEKADEILKIEPDLIISLMGGNDPILGINAEESKENINNLMEKFKGKEVFWMTSLAEMREEKNTEYEEYRKATMEVKCNENQKVFDSFNEFKKYDLSKIYTLKTSEYKDIDRETDPGHPNQLGNAYIARIVLKEMFEIEFNPERFMETTLIGEKYPKY